MLINDHFQNYKSYGIPKAQLVLIDIPYNIGKNAYGSNPAWWIDGDKNKGASKLAGKSFFNTDNDFRITEFLHFCSKLIKKEPKAKGQAPAMIVFCAFDQQFEIIEKAKKYGINGYINLVFHKKTSAQVLKANKTYYTQAQAWIAKYRLFREEMTGFANSKILMDKKQLGIWDKA